MSRMRWGSIDWWNSRPVYLLKLELQEEESIKSGPINRFSGHFIFQRARDDSARPYN